MTNSYILPLEGNNAQLEPDAFNATRDISNLDNQLTKLGKLQNYNFAYLGTGPIITQHFEDGVFYYSGSTRIACQWRIPTLSANHKTINITLKGTGTSGNALFTLSNATSSNTKNFLFNSSKYDQGSITLASITAEYSLLTLTVSGVIQLDYLSIEYMPLTSPLAESKVDAIYMNSFFYPFGDSTFLANQPLSSAIGSQLINNLRVLQRRPRMLFCASGLNLPAASSPTFGAIKPQTGLTINDLFALNTNFIVWKNYNRLSSIYKLVMYVQNSTEYDFVFKIFNKEITLSSGLIPQWIEEDLSVIFNDNNRENYLSMPLIEFKPKPQSIFTNASPILSLSFWGW